MFLSKNNQIKWQWLMYATVIVLGLVFAGIFWLDIPLLLFFREFDGRFWNILSVIFDDKVWAVVFAVLVPVFYIKNNLNTRDNIKKFVKQFNFVGFFKDFWQKTKRSNVFFIFCSIFATGAVVQVLKVVMGRARPILFENFELVGFYPPTFEWAFNSMPSGHTAISFAALVMIGMLAPRIKVLTWTLAIFIGIARVCVGAHWPSDVLLGAFIGMVMADFVKWALVKYTGRDK